MGRKGTTKAKLSASEFLCSKLEKFVGLCSFLRIFQKPRCLIVMFVLFSWRKWRKKLTGKVEHCECNAYWSILISFSYSFNERMQMRMPMVMLKEPRRNFPLQFCAILRFSSLLNIIRWWKRRSYFEEKMILDNNFQFPNNSLSLEKLANMNFVTRS